MSSPNRKPSRSSPFRRRKTESEKFRYGHLFSIDRAGLIGVRPHVSQLKCENSHAMITKPMVMPIAAKTY
jgi:hypothetical protein